MAVTRTITVGIRLNPLMRDDEDEVRALARTRLTGLIKGALLGPRGGRYAFAGPITYHPPERDDPALDVLYRASCEVRYLRPTRRNA